VLFNYSQIQLPVVEIISEVKSSLQNNQTLIVSATPGAGKSTILPLTFLNEAFLNNKKIIMLEPRRLAARGIAMRMAELLGEDVGNTVGYRIRHETRISNSTKIEIVTEGILTRILQNDNALENYGLVIFDEFHERNLQADLALALCRETQQILRPDLRIMIMSATLNIQQLQTLLNAPVIECKGRQYPVEIKYTSDSDEYVLPELMANAIMNAVRNHQEGDILAFFPGEAEIKKCEQILNEKTEDLKIHSLYGQLSQNEQLAAILPNKNNKRKIVLATSIAETSLTIEGIKIVIDSGFSRRSRFDVSSGLSKLETIRITKDAADQRAGRAGRLSDGICYRLWTKATHEKLIEHRTPEIEDADLCSLILELYKWGNDDVSKLCWLTQPPKANVQQAIETLHQIEALNEHKITEHGNQIHQLGCHPRIAHMLLLAQTDEMKSLACDIAGIIEERDPLPKDSGIDLNLRIEALRRARNNHNISNKFKRIEKNVENYRKLLNIKASTKPIDYYDTGLLLAYAYPERIASAKPGNNAQFQLANGKIAVAGHKDDLAHEPWLAIANVNLRDGLGKIFMAAPLNPKDLISMVKEKQNIIWDTKKGGIICATELRIGNIILQSKPLLHPNEQQILNVLYTVVKTEGKNLLNFSDSFIQLQNKILSLKKWNSNQNWPDVSNEELLKKPEKWLGDEIKTIRKIEDFKKINLTNCVLQSLSWEQQQLLEQLAPSALKVPSGSTIKIQYFNNGDSPIIAVRIQEVFGLANTPTINLGKNKTVLHLLSPGYKPVQVTTDLNNFWNKTYQEIKKELQRRYPKHSWPNDPWNAKAVAKGRSNI
jgi:ATP-dependent helicase HrpB